MKMIEESSTKRFAQKRIVKVGKAFPRSNAADSDFGNEDMDVRVPLKAAAEGVEDTDKTGSKAVHEYLVNGGKSCMAVFVLKNTLSDNGGVTRGICKMDENGNLTEVVETKNIVKTAAGAEADGVVVDVNSLVSMNMWGLTLDFLDVLEEGFKEFFAKEVPSNPQKAEYLIPIFIMTYHEDVVAVKDSFKKC